ncbi:MAG TPA: hypothetical protein VMI54_08960 [Polyangiaceae bacterium]|nr:hypothetical protein [Polyangiaceae bacterium]
MRTLIAPALLLASFTAAPAALAQTTAQASGSASGQANVGVALPGATATAAATGTSDHDQMVGRLAVGYFGISDLGAGVAFDGMGNPVRDTNASPYGFTGAAPVVGVRYWLDQMLGLDVGLGMSVVGGAVKNGNASAGRHPFTGVLLHGGVPLALASAEHFTFEIIPELNVGFAHSRNGNGQESDGGVHFDLGARAGAEVSFGFMHLPQLSLVGSVGLRFDTDSANTSVTAGAVTNKWSASRSEFHTTVGPNPWSIFLNQVAALYYF